MGHIKIGRLGETRTAKSGNSYQQPEKLDHFIVTYKRRGPDGNFEIDAEIMAAIGEPAPKRLRVFLPYNDPDLNLLVFYAEYSKSRCLCRGNGEVALRYNESTKTYSQTGCAGADCKTYQDKRCKLTGILNVVLANVPRIGGVHVFRTTSFYSITALQSNMAMFSRLTEGNVAGVPLDLVVSPDTKQPSDGQKVTIYTVSLEFAGTMEDMRSKALALAEGNREFRSRLALAESNAREIMAEVVDEPEDDDAEGVAKEFYPPADEKPAIMEPQAKAEPEPDPPPVNDGPDPVPAPAPDSEKISQQQVKLFFARARSSGFSDDEIKVAVLARGYDHTADILKGDFDDLLKWASGPRGK
jgi:hypothetical protein